MLRRAFRIRRLAVEELRLSQQRFEFVALATPEQRWAYPPGNVIFVAGPEGTYYGKYEGLEKELPGIKRPPLPPGVAAGSHGGSHGYLMNEFVTAILQNRKPLVDIAQALNMTVAGIVAHESALKGGELKKILQFKI